MTRGASIRHPLRVVLLANTLPPRDVSGVGEQVLQLAAGLQARGHEVEVVGRRERGPGASKLLFPLTAVGSLARAVRRFEPDVVQVHESDGGLAALGLRLGLGRGLGAGLRGRRSRPLLLALLQVSYVEERRVIRPLVAPDGRILGQPGPVERRFRRWKAPWQIRLGRLTARLADRVLCPSAQTAEEVARDYGVDGVRVLPNVTGGLERPQEPAGEEAEGALLFVGRLRLRKGVEVLLEALAGANGSAKEETSSHRLPPVILAGDGEHREALESRCRELGLTERVRFVGHRSAAQVRGLLARARALVVPSLYEGMPLVVLEAMEAGRPVVASRVSGIPEVVVDGITGWLVPPEDPSALRRALRELLQDPEEARRRGAAGRQRLDDRYRPHHAAEIWERAVWDLWDTRAARDHR